MEINDGRMDLPNEEPTGGMRDFIPEGKYAMRVIEMGTVTAQTGTPGMQVRFKIIGGDHNGSEINNNYWLTPAAIGIFQGFLKACGVNYKGKGVNVMSAKGKALRVKIRIRKSDQGNDFSEVHWCEAMEGSQPSGPVEPPGNPIEPPINTEDGW